MKKIILIVSFSIFILSCSKDNSSTSTPPQVTILTYQQALTKIGIQLNTFYNYKGVYVNDPIGKIKFNSDQTITEIYNGVTATYGYKFSSNNQELPNLSINITRADNVTIPVYNPKMPVTSLAAHFGFDIQLKDNYGVNKIEIGGLYSYADPTDYWKVLLQ